MLNFKTRSIFLVLGFQYSYQKCHPMYSWLEFAEKTQGLTFLSRNLYGRYPKDFKFRISEYRGHHFDPKDLGSQNVFIYLLINRFVSYWSPYVEQFYNDLT
jgi:hypothetical protein